MKNDLNTFCYIQEQTSFMEDYDPNSFGYEVHDQGNRFYLTFEAVLQSFDVLNRNKRKYDANNIMNIINTDEYIQTMLKNNSWIGEIDHPAAQKEGEKLTVLRIANPSPERSSHYIRKPRLNGNLLEATIQTDSGTQHGQNMAIKIVDGKIVPCFSARSLGSMQMRNGQPYVNVKKLITYDWVLYPSHREASAKITQAVQESVELVENEIGCKVIPFHELAKMAANNSKETEWLAESFDLTTDDVIGVTSTGNSVVLKEDSNIYVQPIKDRRIRHKSKSMLTDWLNS